MRIEPENEEIENWNPSTVWRKNKISLRLTETIQLSYWKHSVLPGFLELRSYLSMHSVYGSQSIAQSFFQEPDPITIFCQNNEPNPITIFLWHLLYEMSHNPIMI